MTWTEKEAGRLFDQQRTLTTAGFRAAEQISDLGSIRGILTGQFGPDSDADAHRSPLLLGEKLDYPIEAQPSRLSEVFL